MFGNAWGVSSSQALGISPVPYVETTGPARVATSAGLSQPDVFVGAMRVSSEGTAGVVKSVAQASNVNLFAGLISAREVTVIATAKCDPPAAAARTIFKGLVVAGVNRGDVEIPPNTAIQVPGFGKIVLNEQTLHRDSYAIAHVNAIRVETFLGQTIVCHATASVRCQ